MQTIRIAHDRVTLPPESVPGFLHTETVGGEFVVQGIECRRIGQPHRKTESSLRVADHSGSIWRSIASVSSISRTDEPNIASAWGCSADPGGNSRPSRE